jgi:RHS repeat-associated protein
MATVIHNGPGAGVYFPVYDGNGNVMGYVRASDGGMVAQYEYGPFGELLRATGPLAQTFNHLFSTKYFDWETGLSYYGHRYYSPTPGRWPNRDPIGELGGINLFTYVGNNPINYFDPFGLTDCAALKAAIARMTGSIHGALHSMGDINQVFDSAQTSAGISLGISAIFAAQSVTGLGKALTANASKTAPILTGATKGTLPVGVFTSSGKIGIAGSFEFNYTMYAADAARNRGAALIGAKEAGSTLAQEGAQDTSKTVQRILDPYGRLADVQNELGASMSAQTYQTIKTMQGTLRGMMDEYRKNCCK